jgi:hypothetical protein
LVRNEKVFEGFLLPLHLLSINNKISKDQKAGELALFLGL